MMAATTMTRSWLAPTRTPRKLTGLAQLAAPRVMAPLWALLPMTMLAQSGWISGCSALVR